MDALHYTIIRALERCTFLPGSYEKRFVRDMAGLGTYDMLSQKQVALVEKLGWNYRRQIGKKLIGKPYPKPSKEDLQALEDWKAGKPL